MNPIFEQKQSRADLHYTPLCKELKDVVCFGDLSKQKDREMLNKILENY